MPDGGRLSVVVFGELRQFFFNLYNFFFQQFVLSVGILGFLGSIGFFGFVVEFRLRLLPDVMSPRWNSLL